ncbi:HU family DNA-binding protein [Bacteroides sp. 51]|uniref:HU family DNA-binding protein n=1 Tax=Bacteroides sp. 51 TaxID=2302938 RepID=UPI0013D234DA|nr:HU family DNA-binding protein [Bacteroides sp. 51]NDV83740.1 HU family DNA-binding protein [Bacteroides sp. 51]
MNNKEFTTELSQRLGTSSKETAQTIESLLSELVEELQNGKSVTIQGFGSFEVKKKAERISVNPTTKERMLVPPKLVLSYKPSNILKEKFK